MASKRTRLVTSIHLMDFPKKIIYFCKTPSTSTLYHFIDTGWSNGNPIVHSHTQKKKGTRFTESNRRH